MGSYFSGNRRSDSRPVAEDFWALDINALAREGILKMPGEPCIWRWQATRGGKPTARIGIFAGHFDGIDGTPGDRPNFLKTGWYRGDDLTGQITPIEWRRCNYGGRRPYFLCPWCATRRTKLFLIGGRHFICRNCAGLTYVTRLEHWPDRMLRRAGKIRTRQLNAGPSILNPMPRPRGMHRAKYYRLLAKVEGMEAAAMAWADDRERGLL